MNPPARAVWTTHSRARAAKTARPPQWVGAPAPVPPFRTNSRETPRPAASATMPLATQGEPTARTATYASSPARPPSSAPATKTKRRRHTSGDVEFFIDRTAGSAPGPHRLHLYQVVAAIDDSRRASGRHPSRVPVVASERNRVWLSERSYDIRPVGVGEKMRSEGLEL